MSAIKVIMESGFSGRFTSDTADFSPSGKFCSVSVWKRRETKSFVWGRYSPELAAKGRALNAKREALDAEVKLFEAELVATQASVLDEAAKAPRAKAARIERVPGLRL